MQAADTIKAELSMKAVAEMYGFHVNRVGFTLCPFHAEKSPSLKIYSEPGRGFHCFGCQASGSVIDFVMQLFNLSFPQAVIRLNADFGLGLAISRPNPAAKERARRDRAAKERVGRLDAIEYSLALVEYWCLRRTIEAAEPYSQIWAWAASRIDAAEEEVAGWNTPKTIS